MSEPIKEAKLKEDLKTYAKAIEKIETILEEGREDLPQGVRSQLGQIWPDLSHIAFKLKSLSNRKIVPELLKLKKLSEMEEDHGKEEDRISTV